MEIFNQRIAELIVRTLRQQELSSPEQLELQQWLDLSDHNRQVYEQLKDADKLKELLHEYDDLRRRIHSKIGIRLSAARPEDPHVIELLPVKRRRIGLYVAAAVLLFVLITSYIWLASLSHVPSKARPAAPLVVQDVAPGGDKATLTLGNGSMITLQDAADGALATQGDARISKAKNQLSYSSSSASSEILYNTLTTPRAGQFSLVLPDGSKVWLNNASSLRYPTNFTGNAREVELNGEAYFEVVKNTKPFAVKLKGLSVIVLGTSFNIMGYDDEPSVRTTLLSGKVSISSADEPVILSPRQQAVLDHGTGAITVASDIDPEEAIAWQRGYFHYAHANIKDVLRQLARWYDVEVEYTMTVPDDQTADGEIGRDLKLSTILKHLEKPDLHFRIEGRKLIVFK